MMTAGEIAIALGGKRTGQGRYVAKCPAHEDRSPSLSLRDADGGRVLWRCHAGCSQRDVGDVLMARGLWEARERAPAPSKPKPPAAVGPLLDNGGKARWLWQRSRPIQGSIAEIYLRCERGITCPLPATLRFLAGNDRYPAAMLAAFGIAHEPEPGVIAIDERAIRGVHLTKLTADGRKHSDWPNKIMLGTSMGSPIVLAPMNDLLGLAITEGIEDALSVHQVTGLGAWAAGSATRMPALAEAVPDYADCVSIIADADSAGQSNAARLAELLSERGVHAKIIASAGSDT